MRRRRRMGRMTWGRRCLCRGWSWRRRRRRRRTATLRWRA
jgi:hypothetical protein